MASEIRPGGPLQSSENSVVFVIKNAQHADDTFTESAMANLGLRPNPEVVKVQEESLEIMKKWVSEFQAPEGA